MNHLDWHKLRPWKGSQHTAFEQLCCQLAEAEPAPIGSRFIRKGAPDAGVECFRILQDGDEHAWQAKFLDASPNHRQWSQIDDSVRTALSKHPRLTRYTVCVPLDRPDPRRKDQTSFLERWDDRVELWKSWAADRQMTVEFVFWGDYEISSRLMDEEHRGRLIYWFNEDKLSNRWFEERLEESISNVGPRYTPELNVDLPVARVFEALGRTAHFHAEIDRLIGEVKQRFSKFDEWATSIRGAADPSALQESYRDLVMAVESIDRTDQGRINFDPVVAAVREAEHHGDNLIHSLRPTGGAALQRTTPSPGHDAHERSRHIVRRIDDYLSALSALERFLAGTDAKLANHPYLLLTGDAGTGKTHLFCDVATKRIRDEAPTVLLIGTQFDSRDPWTQILELLGLSCTKEEFLGALDAVAQVTGRRALILIDALNEGEGRRLWKPRLAGFLTTVARYPRVGIALSVRSSYETTVIPPGLIPARMLRVTHQGFASQEFDATSSFFRHYQIEQPSVPLLLPEFRNPLFLSLFCKGLRNRHLHQVPPGHAGVSAIFDLFIESVESKLAGPSELDYDPHTQPVRQAVTNVAHRMAETARAWLPRTEAAEIVNRELPREGYERSLLRHLVSEGILVEDRRLARSGGAEEVVHFCYERFSEHLIAAWLLDTHVDHGDPKAAFAPDGPLGKYCVTPSACYCHQGLLNAFAVQMPERLGVELIELVPHVATSEAMRSAFVESLVWRDPGAMATMCYRLVDAMLSSREEGESSRGLLDALVRIATREGHPFNADYLHARLWPMPMADRDAWWSTYLHAEWAEPGAMSVLITWAGSDHPKDHLNDSAVLRAATLLAWCLTTPNRFIRDQATKALVRLLEQRVGVLRQLLHRFKHVNDPYVAERLYAAALGCAVRSQDSASVIALGQDVYDQVFKEGQPPVDILLRDYARGVVDEAMRRGLTLSGDPIRVRPPYRSSWNPDVPTADELRRRAEGTADSEKRPGVYSLTSSVLRDGDFSRYVLGTNAGGLPWSSIPLSDPIGVRSMRFRFSGFIASLSPAQKELWEQYSSLRAAIDVRESMSHYTDTSAGEDEVEQPIEQDKPCDSTAGGVTFDASPLVKMLAEAMRSDVFDGLSRDEQLTVVESARLAFVALLDDTLRKEYAAVATYSHERQRYDREDAFNASLVERWILHRVLELGWRSDKHGRFDSTVREHDRGRDAHKPERIGKKYQWIALHECYARLADNFHFRKHEFADEPRSYEGAWQLGFLRDIDPTCIRQAAPDPDPQSPAPWYSPAAFEWQTGEGDREWIRKVEDFPDLAKLPCVVSPADGQDWLILKAGYSWDEPRYGRGRLTEYPFRRIYCLLNAYIVAKPDLEAMYDWACQQDYMNHWMPECRDIYSLHYGEMHSSAALSDTLRADPEVFGPTQGSERRCPRSVRIPVARYVREGHGFDCSIEDSVTLYVPSPFLREHMGLAWSGREGRYNSRQNELIALDTSTESGEPACFAVRRREFEEILNARNMAILWTVLGGKDIIRDPHRDDEFVGRFVLNGALRLGPDGIRGRVHTTLYQRGWNEPLTAFDIIAGQRQYGH